MLAFSLSHHTKDSIIRKTVLFSMAVHIAMDNDNNKAKNTVIPNINLRYFVELRPT